MPKQTILLIEDEKDIAFILGQTFRAEGFAFLAAETAEDGLKLARKHKPALVISDIMLPRMDGLSMVKELRRESQVPVLFLTARKDESDRVRGFQVGADDYLAKPFSMRELVCRVRAVLRRKEGRAAPAREEGVKVGDLELDFARREARVNGKFRHLAPREFQLLRMLVEADGKVLTREHLLKEIWGYDESIGISTRTVDQHVARLRRKLLGERKRLLTVKNVGYRLKPA